MCVYLSFNLIEEELFLEVVEGIVGTITVQIQWVQDVPDGNRRETESLVAAQLVIRYAHSNHRIG